MLLIYLFGENPIFVPPPPNFLGLYVRPQEELEDHPALWETTLVEFCNGTDPNAIGCLISENEQKYICFSKKNPKYNPTNQWSA